MKQTMNAAGDLLVGAEAIRAYLAHLGMPEDVDVYYLRRARRWPIGKTAGEGGSLIASKRRLIQTRRKNHARPRCRLTRCAAAGSGAVDVKSGPRAPAPSPEKAAPGSRSKDKDCGGTPLYRAPAPRRQQASSRRRCTADRPLGVRDEPALAVRPALAKLIRLLASDVDGEVLAAVRALGRALKASGSDFHDLAGLVEAPSTSAEARAETNFRNHFDGDDDETELPWQLMVDACTNHPGRFTSRSGSFSRP